MSCASYDHDDKESERERERERNALWDDDQILQILGQFSRAGERFVKDATVKNCKVQHSFFSLQKSTNMRRVLEASSIVIRLYSSAGVLKKFESFANVSSIPWTIEDALELRACLKFGV